jgi:hypothetical protein
MTNAICRLFLNFFALLTEPFRLFLPCLPLFTGPTLQGEYNRHLVMLNIARGVSSRSFYNYQSSTFRRTMSTQIPERMKCILIKDGKGPAENLYLGEEPVPQAKEGEVLVKVSYLYHSKPPPING